jgi:hypothetical protein
VRDIKQDLVFHHKTAHVRFWCCDFFSERTETNELTHFCFVTHQNIQDIELFVCAFVPAIGLVWMVGLAITSTLITKNWKVLIGVSTQLHFTFFFLPLLLLLLSTSSHSLYCSISYLFLTLYSQRLYYLSFLLFSVFISH